MEFYEVIKTRRSVRSYSDRAITSDTLERVLGAARIAPSGSNRQPTRLILVRDPEERRALVPLCGGQEFIAEAPLVIVACGRNIRYNRGGYMGDCSVIVDVAIAVDHLTLAARAEGLGTCWIGSFDNSALKAHLRMPEDVNVVALTPVGYPRERAFSDNASRLSLKDLICESRWGF